MPHCDVAVVGAGPAGTAAAIVAARSGLDVVVVDKASFPRDKCCGDGLTAAALRELDGLGLDPATVEGWTPVANAWLRSVDGRVVELALPRGSGLYAAVAPRLALDAALVALARDAGAEVRDATAVLGAVATADQVTLELDGGPALTAGYVIGADGVWSPLRKAFGLDTAGYLGEWHAFRQYWDGLTGPARDRLWVAFEPDLLPGYLWSFPLGGGRANVGFGILRGGRITTHDMKVLWPELLARPHVRELLGPDAAPTAPHRAWPIPARVGDVALTDGRVLFVGDAAAASDPLTGEGIGQALATGRWAAEAIATAGGWSGGRDRAVAPAEVAARYETQVARELVVDHRLAAALSRLMGNPTAARLTLAATGCNDWTRRNFARWLFEDYPRAILATPARWHRRMLTGAGAYR